jgi:hypothetical protein
LHLIEVLLRVCEANPQRKPDEIRPIII